MIAANFFLISIKQFINRCTGMTVTSKGVSFVPIAYYGWLNRQLTGIEPVGMLTDELEFDGKQAEAS